MILFNWIQWIYSRGVFMMLWAPCCLSLWIDCFLCFRIHTKFCEALNSVLIVFGDWRAAEPCGFPTSSHICLFFVRYHWYCRGAACPALVAFAACLNYLYPAIALSCFNSAHLALLHVRYGFALTFFSCLFQREDCCF